MTRLGDPFSDFGEAKLGSAWLVFARYEARDCWLSSILTSPMRLEFRKTVLLV